MKTIKTVDAEGHILCHDITQIIKGVTKDVVFKKGHVVTGDDIPVLLSVGKDTLYVWEKQEGFLHENEAAEILFEICAGENMRPSPVKEGKIDLIAEKDGILKVNIEKLHNVNMLGEMMIASRHNNFPVKEGDKVAGTRIIPLTIEEEKMMKARETAGEIPLLSIKPFLNKKIGIIVTGNEVFHGRIKDTFSEVIIEKVREYGGIVTDKIILDDNHKKITQNILNLIEKGAEMVICTGGMSVDPDDKTPLAIKNTGAEIISYGAPVLPGAMFLLSYYKGKIPVMGLPGCVMYAKRTVFDLILPRVMADDKVSAAELAALGHGGYCMSCERCTFPACAFGKGA